MFVRAQQTMVNTQRHPLRLYLFIFLAAIYFAIPNARPDLSEFNSHDPGSYLALSHNLIHGAGYTRNIESTYIPHKLWPPGMPLILAPAILVSGDTLNWLAVKTITISIGLMGLGFIWLLLYRMTTHRWLADIGVVIFGFNPYYWHFSHIALAELPVFIHMVAALILIHWLWSKAHHCGVFFAVGVLCGAGMMIKGTAIGLAFAPLAYFFSGNGHLAYHQRIVPFVKDYSAFFIGFFVCFVLWLMRNAGIPQDGLGLDGVNQIQMLFKTVAEDPTSRYRTFAEIVQTAKENALWHGIYHYSTQQIPLLWLVELRAIPMGNVLALLLTLGLILLSIPRTINGLAIYITIGPMFVMMLLMVIGGSERYWLAISFLSLLVCLINLPIWLKRFGLDEHFRVMRARYVVPLAGILLVSLSTYIYQFEQHPYNPREGYTEWGAFLETLEGICTQPEYQHLVIDSRNNATVRFVTGCRSPMTNAALDILPQYNAAIIPSTQLTAEAKVLFSSHGNQLVSYTTE